MPHAMIAKFARKAKMTQHAVEKIWNETKKEAKEKFNPADPHYWAYVTDTVKNKIGIEESIKTTFKDFLAEKKKESEIPLEDYIQAGDSVEVVAAIPGLDIALGSVFSVNDVDEKCRVNIQTGLGTEVNSKYFEKKYFKKVQL